MLCRISVCRISVLVSVSVGMWLPAWFGGKRWGTQVFEPHPHSLESMTFKKLKKLIVTAGDNAVGQAGF